MDVSQRIASIIKRLSGLKAERKVRLNQIAMLEQEWNFNLTLNPGEQARYTVTFYCSSPPIFTASLSGFPIGDDGFRPSTFGNGVSGNSGAMIFRITNASGSPSSHTITIRGWALNGLSATCVRTM